MPSLAPPLVLALVMLCIFPSHPQTPSLTEQLKAINALIKSQSWETLASLTLLGLESRRSLPPTHSDNQINHDYYHGIALYHLGLPSEALPYLETATLLAPESETVLDAVGQVKMDLWDCVGARGAYRVAFDTGGEREVYFQAKILKSGSWVCDFEDYEKRVEELVAVIEGATLTEGASGELRSDLPIFTTDLPDGVLNRLSNAALKSLTKQYPLQPPYPTHPTHDAGTPLRVGFISSDWSVHPVSTLIRSLITTLGTSSAITPILLSLTPSTTTPSWWQTNVTNTLPPSSFHVLSHLSPSAACTYIRSLDLSILLDLNGHTQNSGLPILSYNCAPVQASYLGLPETTGNGFVDYYIGDATSVALGGPGEGGAGRFEERLAVLGGGSYIANDYQGLQGHVAGRYPFRLSYGGTTSFEGGGERVHVACFSNWQKLDPVALDMYANALRMAENSVLVFFEYKGVEQARERVVREFEARGVWGGRIGFVEQQAWIVHTWRKGAFDLAFDSFEKNGHTTGLDSIWAGVPTVTREGALLSQRVGMSIQGEEGLGVASCGKDWEDVAVAFMRDGWRREAWRKQQAALRVKMNGVFDGEAMAREFESVLKIMREREGETALHLVRPKLTLANGTISLDTQIVNEDVDNFSTGSVKFSKQPKLNLHIGGQVRCPGWTVVDSIIRPGIVDSIGEMGALTAFGNGTAAALYASHVLEHAHYGVVAPPGSTHSVTDVLKEWARVLEEGGRVFISVPDLEGLARMYLDARSGVNHRYFIMRMMFGGQSETTDAHYVGWDEDMLVGFLDAAGFCNMRRVDEFVGVQWEDSSNLWYDWTRNTNVRGEKEVGGKGGAPVSLNLIAEKC